MLHVEKVGPRVYVVGDSYPVRDRLKAAGCHWDSERRQWWAAWRKAEQIGAIVAAAAADPAPEPAVVPDSARVYGKAVYKGRTYYVIADAVGSGRLRLAALDGKVSFWADKEDCEQTKQYPAREYRGRTEYQTLGSLRRFAERQRDPATRSGPCTECGHWGPSGEPCSECCGEGSHA